MESHDVNGDPKCAIALQAAGICIALCIMIQCFPAQLGGFGSRGMSERSFLNEIPNISNLVYLECIRVRSSARRSKFSTGKRNGSRPRPPLGHVYPGGCTSRTVALSGLSKAAVPDYAVSHQWCSTFFVLRPTVI